MSEFILSDCDLYWDGYRLRSDTNQVTVSATRDILDKSKFGDQTRKKMSGLDDVSVSVEGHYQADADNTAVDDALYPDVGAVPSLFTVIPESPAVGNIAYAMKSLIATYEILGEHGDITPFTLSGEGAEKLIRGKPVLLGTYSSTQSGGAVELQGVSSGQKVYAVAHVFSKSGTSPTLDITIQSDDASGFDTPTDVITFSQFTDVGSEWATDTTVTTDTYWRADITVGGTGSPEFGVMVFVGIR